MRAALCLLLLCPPALACPVTYSSVAYAPAKYKVEAAVAVPVVPVVAVSVLVPAYSAAYTPAAAALPVAPAPAAAPAAEPNLLQELQSLRKELQELRSGQPAAAAQPAADPFARVVQAKCFSCHGAAKQEAGLDLRGDWSADTAAKVAREVLSGHMPKGGTLSPAERQAFADKLFPRK